MAEFYLLQGIAGTQSLGELPVHRETHGEALQKDTGIATVRALDDDLALIRHVHVLQMDEVRHGVNVVGTTIPYPIDGGGIGKPSLKVAPARAAGKFGYGVRGATGHDDKLAVLASNQVYGQC